MGLKQNEEALCAGEFIAQAEVFRGFPGKQRAREQEHGNKAQGEGAKGPQGPQGHGMDVAQKGERNKALFAEKDKKKW